MNAEPLYNGNFSGAPGKYWTEIDWSRVRSDLDYCKAVYKRFIRTLDLYKCTIANRNEVYSEKSIYEAKKDLPHVRDCCEKLNALIKEIEVDNITWVSGTDWDYPEGFDEDCFFSRYKTSSRMKKTSATFVSGTDPSYPMGQRRLTWNMGAVKGKRLDVPFNKLTPRTQAYLLGTCTSR
tara:strand:+ start:409 stop:945 length:537 start_codon:yes stop_codon:yes gene_type:complete